MGFAFNPLAYLASVVLPLGLAGAVGWALVQRGWASRVLAAAVVAAAPVVEYALLIAPQRAAPEARPYVRAGVITLVVPAVVTITILLAAGRGQRDQLSNDR